VNVPSTTIAPIADPGLCEDDVWAAISASACAAVRWFECPKRSDALSHLLQAIALADRATNGTWAARRPTEFLALLEAPLLNWMPTRLAESLVSRGRPTDFCLDLDAEGGADPEAERVQAKVGSSRARFAVLADGGEREYAAFRRFLIEHGSCGREEAQAAVALSGIGPAELYEPIPAICHIRTAAGSVFYPCPDCRWPMIVQDETLACPWPACAAGGARFQLSGSTIRPVGGRETPSPVPVEGAVRLKRGAWRYTLLPGLTELGLADRLARLPGVSVRLWPGRDRYDLHVELGDKWVWRADVKDWSNPDALAARLQCDQPAGEMLVVVPDRHRWQVSILRHRLNGTNWRPLSCAELVQEVRRRAQPKERRRRRGKGQ
jgi:hypothetical protein